MTRRTDLQDAIIKLKKLKALQQKATDKLNKIGDKAAGKKPAGKKAKPAVKKKAKTPVKKKSFWSKLFGVGGKKGRRKR